MTEPITVLMPVYNGEAYIREAINSVLSQTWENFELLIINDGSTDSTGEIARSFSDTRIRLIDTAHAGIAAALNSGLALSKYDLIARFDADDICMPDRLEKQHAFLVNHPDHVLTGSDATYIMDDGEWLFDFSCPGHTDDEIRLLIFQHCPVIHSAVMFRKEAVQKAGGYPQTAHNFEDHFLWIQLMAYGKLHNIPEKLIQVRFSAGSSTMDEKWRGRKFRSLKQQILKRGTVTEAEEDLLKNILQRQATESMKRGAYHALCAKKFLANRFDPPEARRHLEKAIRFKPLRPDNYLLYLISFFPEKWVEEIYRLSR
jgi:glycosyltransferase involved in cell wall biosynthesis